jgi:hypothetical protein
MTQQDETVPVRVKDLWVCIRCGVNSAPVGGLLCIVCEIEVNEEAS